MDFKKLNFLKSCMVTFFITFSVFAQPHDRVDLDWYRYGQTLKNLPERVDFVYPMYPFSSNPGDNYSVQAVESKSHPAIEYYNDNINPASFVLRRKAEYLERIRAKAFTVPDGYPVSLRDILNLTNINRFPRNGQDNYSQLPEIDLSDMDNPFSQYALQNAADVLRRQMEEISNKFANIVYDSLIKNNTDNGMGASNFVRVVLGDLSSTKNRSFQTSTEQWTGEDPLSILVKQKFMSRYPRVLRSSDVTNRQGPFIRNIQILIKSNHISKKQANALINKFELLAESLVDEKDNLAAHLVGKSIKDDFKIYELAEYYSRSFLFTCRNFYTK